jgi:putative phosphoribosyl transferase
MIFRDRQEAGRLLAKSLDFLGGEAKAGHVVVLAVPRGGVVVGYEIARALNAPLDVYVTRKVGAPGNPELAIGAVASVGNVVLDERLISDLRISRSYVDAEIARQREEIARRVVVYRGHRPPLDLADKIAILTDDGVATGSTILAAIRGLRHQPLRQLVLALPVGPPDTLARLEREVDRLICLHASEAFWAVGAFYAIFSQASDKEVTQLLDEARRFGQSLDD